MNKLDKTYTDLLQDILDNGTSKSDRTGTGTISVFGRQIRHKMSEGFPLLTTKKMPFKTIVTELLWFLRGDTNIKYLVDNNCHIWDGDAYKNYKNKTEIMMGHGFHGTLLSQEEFIERIKTDDEFAKTWGELGKIYGAQWRRWSQYEINMPGFDAHFNETQIDQIQNLINDLKTNPDSRRLMVNAWNVGELDQMVLPPCHYGFQVYTRELSLNDRILEFAKRDLDPSEFRKGGKYGTVIPEGKTLEVLDNHNIPKRAISLMFNMRSIDTFLGLPFNIASYGLLLEIIAKEVNMVPDELIGNLGDVHLYSNHIEQAKEQIGRELTLDERLDLADIFNPLIREDCLTKTHHDDETEELKLAFRNEWLDGLGVIPKRTREPYQLPRLNFSDWYKNANNEKHSEIVFNEWIESIKIDDFIIENYQSHPTIKAPLSN
jgi:thymidylate synthase